MEPIIGYRYKFSKCKNYNLCQKCEEKNKISEDHPHHFIKIEKEKNGSDIIFNIPNNNTINAINYNNINNNKIGLVPDKNSLFIDINKVYLYECLNVSQLSKEIYQGTNEAKIDIILLGLKINRN